MRQRVLVAVCPALRIQKMQKSAKQKEAESASAPNRTANPPAGFPKANLREYLTQGKPCGAGDYREHTGATVSRAAVFHTAGAVNGGDGASESEQERRHGISAQSEKGHGAIPEP